MRRSSIVVVIAFAVIGVLGGVAPVFAQEASPAAEPIIVPAPNQCTVEPRDIAFYDQFVGTPSAATTMTASPVGAAPIGAGIEGEPADRATRAAVLDTVRQVLACINAGNILARHALFTDAYLTNAIASSPGMTAEDLATLAAEPVPLEGDQAALLAILDVRTLADGRVAVLIDILDPSSSPPSPLRLLFTMVEQDGRYLIDAEVSESIDSSQVGTPAA